MMRLALVCPALVAACVAVSAADPPPAKVSYFKDVRPIFQQNCVGCHQPAKPGGNYVMTEFASLAKAGDSGDAGVVAGHPEKSRLLALVTPRDGKAEMPQNRPPLSATQVATITQWIKEGAADDTPASAKAVQVDADRPPVYRSAPVVTSVAFSPDGKLLAVAGYHEILLHKADGSGIVARLVGMSERVQSLAFSPDGKLLAASGGDPGRFGEIQIWDMERGKLKLSTTLTFDTLYGVSWSPDGKLVAVGCADNTVRAVEADTGKQALFMGTHSDWVLGTVFARDGLHLVSVSRDMSMKLTEVATQRFIDNVTSITPGALKGGLMALDRRPQKEKKMAKQSPDMPNAAPRVYDELIVAGSDGTPRLYKMHRETKRIIGDDANRLKVYDKEPMPGRISSVQFDADGKRFAATSSLDGKGEVRVYDVESAKYVTFEKLTSPMYTVAWHPSGTLVASSGFDGKVYFHDPATGKLVKAFAAVPTIPDTIPLAGTD